MAVLGRLRAWWRSLLGRGQRHVPEEYQCAVCGTAVEDPDEECPLCHSTDIVADGEETDESAPGGTRHAVAADSGAETALEEVLGGENDPLARHDDKWERVDGSKRYRVENPDGGVDRAGSRDEARALLRRYYD